MGFAIQTEEQFMQTVIDLAVLRQWRVYHTRDSRGSRAGFPDLVLVKGGVLVFAELKLEGEKPTAAQRLWLEELREVAARTPYAVRVFLWTPADWHEIEGVLGG